MFDSIIEDKGRTVKPTGRDYYVTGTEIIVFIDAFECNPPKLQV